MRHLTMGFTPDPDDAVAVYALATGMVRPSRFQLHFAPRPIDELNECVRRGELDVAAISSVFYPHVQGNYAILRCGSSVGRGYGPRVVSHAPATLEDLDGRVVAVPGTTTTGATLLSLFAPRARPSVMPFDRIRAAVRERRVVAGVLIHEELLEYSRDRLHLVACLGREWQKRTSLPLPVGLNVVRRELGDTLCREIARCLEVSIRHALRHPTEAFEWALRFARSANRSTSKRFAAMFTNEDTLALGDDGERGLRRLFDLLAEAGKAPRVDTLELVDPTPSAASSRAAPSEGRCAS